MMVFLNMLASVCCGSYDTRREHIPYELTTVFSYRLVCFLRDRRWHRMAAVRADEWRKANAATPDTAEIPALDEGYYEVRGRHRASSAAS